MKKIIYILILIFWTNFVQGQELLKSGDSLVKSGSSVVKIWTPNELNNTFGWSGGQSGSNLIDISGNNTIIPIVSGSVVNGMLDTSVVLDMENLGGVWDKQRYVGNGFAKPETWDFPYYYYDVSNPYHWKVYELSYRLIEEQCLLDSNFCFARYRYDIGQKIDRLYIFSTPQNSDLAQIKKDIWVANDFFGANLVKNPTFTTTANWVTEPSWSISGGTANCDGISTNTFIFQNIGASQGTIYYTEFEVLNYVANTVRIEIGATLGALRTANGVYTQEIIGGGGGNEPAVLFKNISNFAGSIDNIVVRMKYINYYRHETIYN